jgi:biotin carboxyl carrier protein
MKFEIHSSGQPSTKVTRVVELKRTGDTLQFSLDGQPIQANAVEVAPNTFSILLGGQSFEVHVTPLPDGTLQVQTAEHEFIAQVVDPRAWRGRHTAAEAEGRQQILAPMPGKVIRVLVKAGDRVEAGQGLLVVEAMKMQNEIRSPKSGTVERVVANEGQLVNAGEVLAWVD